MAVHSFSTQTKRPQDEIIVREVKDYCRQRHINFSGIVLDLLAKYHQEVASGDIQR